MFDIIASADRLFGTAAFSYKEIIPDLVCKYDVGKSDLPSAECLKAFLGLRPERDRMNIMFFSDDADLGVSDEVDWLDKYETYVSELYDDDRIKVVIKIEKEISEGKLSVYNLQEFSKFLCELKTEEIFENFTRIFKECGEYIIFQLLDTNASLKTKSIAFSNNEVQWTEGKTRKELLKDCDNACVFLEREKIRLIPQDFDAISVEGNEIEKISDLFKRLKSILSYIYLSNSTTVIDGKAILQFNPSAKGYEYDLDQLAVNNTIPQIYDWIFGDNSCVDKAGIARAIINTYCCDKESILAIDEKIFNSIKSDYVIYQEKYVAQYIDMKNKISEFIVKSAEEIQDLSHEIVDALRNNFVAVIVFLMTVLLTDSIDFTQFLKKEVSLNVVLVCIVFTMVTILYLFITVFMYNWKWNWLEQSYSDLKKNYESVFVAADLEEAFNHDESFKNAEKRCKKIRNRICIIWILLIIVMICFSVCLILSEGPNIILYWQSEMGARG